MKKIFLSAFIAFLAHSPSSFAAVCADLSADLSQKSTGVSVTALQSYLKEAGYLSAVPNGYFGPATFAAVKKFQSANGIDSTGYVGPATRAAIKTKSCGASPAPVQSSPAPSQTSSLTASVTLPEEGQTLTIGKTSSIRWKTEIRGSYDVILEDENGIAKGYIASNLWGGKSHEWKAGSITSAASDDKLVPTGKYKIRIRTNSSGEDQVSGIFTLDGPALRVSSVIPSTVSSGDDSAIVLYGRGFTNSTSVYIDGVRNVRTSRLFVSPDGKVLVFSIPESLSRGSHAISLRNAYGEIPNAATITVE